MAKDSEKHVIILGAGASITSGYPEANRLAVLMCDAPTFLKRFHETIEEDIGYDPGTYYELRLKKIREHHKSFLSASSLLRDGDFATMDELSNLVQGGAHAARIHELKRLMRFVFGLSEPHTRLWPKSDYRKFIQSLFIGQSHLRSDVSVISFNYDPYLEYRLAKALRSRTSVRPIPDDDFNRMELAATSGFLDPNDLTWLVPLGFSHLKLHGTAVLPLPKGIVSTSYPPKAGESSVLTSAHLIGLPAFQRFMCLSDQAFSKQDPPALLPWEIISSDGKLLELQQFEKIVGNDWQHRNLYLLFASLWRRARREIQEADQISFVGLSIGAFMEPELRYLFEGRTKSVKLVVANKDNEKVKDGQSFHPWTVCGKTLKLLNEICPSMLCQRSFRDLRQIDDSKPFHETAYSVTPRNDFADFIENEM